LGGSLIMAFGTVKADALQTDSRIIGVDEIVGLEPNVVPALGDSVFWNGTQWVAASGGTITSAALQVPSGLAVAGSPIVSSGTFAVTYASGHQAYTTAEADKLATVASGAEVNVNADWTAASGDAFILNKPPLGTAAAFDVGTSSGNVVQLDGLAKLPAVDGSQLTGINSTTDLSYDTPTRFLDSSTGSGVTLPIFASGVDGFVPAASGGTTSFLREDGTWQPVVGSTNLSYDDSTRVLSSSTGSGVTLPVFASGVAGLVPATSSGGTTTFLRADGEFAAAGAAAAGDALGQIQYNDGNSPAGLAASSGLTWDDTGKVLEVGGDVNLDDGGTFTTTLQTVTPTANRTISFPNATGTVALTAGSSGQTLYNLSGALAGTSTTFDATTGTRFVVPFGYGAGAGGTVTQATNKSTGATLNTRCGTVTMNGAELAADTTVSFTLTNSQIAATDVVMLNHASAGTAGAYTLNAQAAAGSASINVRNVTGAALSEAIVIRFAVIKATIT
jgi:hypothetical protein